jgi:hypothetical protein
VKNEMKNGRGGEGWKEEEERIGGMGGRPEYRLLVFYGAGALLLQTFFGLTPTVNITGVSGARNKKSATLVKVVNIVRVQWPTNKFTYV